MDYCKIIQYKPKNSRNQNVIKFIQNLRNKQCFCRHTSENTIIFFTGNNLDYCPFIETTQIINRTFQPDNLCFIETKNSIYVIQYEIIPFFPKEQYIVQTYNYTDEYHEGVALISDFKGKKLITVSKHMIGQPSMSCCYHIDELFQTEEQAKQYAFTNLGVLK